MANMDLESQVREQVFADPTQENYVCTAGQASLKQYLHSGKLDKGFAVLSDFSVYCKGKCLVQKKGESPRKRLVEYRIDVPDIAGVKYVRRNPSWLLSLCYFFLILAPVVLILELLTHFSESTSLTPIIDVVVCLLLSACFGLIYLLHRKNYLQITYSRGAISLNANDLPDTEERLFVKNLRALLSAWDAYVEQQNYKSTYNQAYDQAYSQGYQSGYNQAYAPGYVQGYNSGYAQSQQNENRQ